MRRRPCLLHSPPPCWRGPSHPQRQPAQIEGGGGQAHRGEHGPNGSQQRTRTLHHVSAQSPNTQHKQRGSPARYTSKAILSGVPLCEVPRACRTKWRPHTKECHTTDIHIPACGVTPRARMVCCMDRPLVCVRVLRRPGSGRTGIPRGHPRLLPERQHRFELAHSAARVGPPPDP